MKADKRFLIGRLVEVSYLILFRRARPVKWWLGVLGVL